MEDKWLAAHKTIEIVRMKLKRTTKKAETARMLAESQSRGMEEGDDYIQNVAGTLQEVFHDIANIVDSLKESRDIHSYGRPGDSRNEPTTPDVNVEWEQDCYQELMS